MEVSEERNRIFGSAPQITSPLERTPYVLRPGVGDHDHLPLRAISDGEVRELYWFADESFLGRATPDEVVFWQLRLGPHVIRVVDDLGRSDLREIVVEPAP
jgi:penicillin-binding protein 1C